MSRHARRRLSGSAVFTGALAIGVALGLGGSSLALWSDAEGVTGEIESGYEYFAAGAPGSVVAAADGEASFTIDGTEAAEALIEEGEFAAAIQVDSLSQGNKGLRYNLHEPDWGDGILGQADIDVFWVGDDGDCDVGAEPPTPPETVEGLSSTPVAAEYSESEDLTTEYWCLHATLDGPPVEGEYTNLGSVTAVDPGGTEVSADDDWSAVVTTAFDPADEGNYDIVFTYITFRPGA